MTDNPALSPQRQPEDADAALRPKLKFAVFAAALVLAASGDALAARDHSTTDLLPPAVIQASDPDYAHYFVDTLRSFHSEPLWTDRAMQGYSERYRFTYFGILTTQLQVQIDLSRKGEAHLKAQILDRQGLLEDESFRLSPARYAEFRKLVDDSALWKTYPEFWVGKGEDAICIDGMEALVEKRDASGYFFSEANTSCTSPPGMNRLISKMTELARLKTKITWFPWDL